MPIITNPSSKVCRSGLDCGGVIMDGGGVGLSLSLSLSIQGDGRPSRRGANKRQYLTRYLAQSLSSPESMDINSLPSLEVRST
jgi:hypothetical protein